MRKLVVLFMALKAAWLPAAVFERFLNPEAPKDRAILNYLELEKQGKAQSSDLAELGVLLLEKGFPEDGARYLEKALDLDKNNVEARYRLGLVLQHLGQDKAAARQYRKVVKARPGFAEAQFMLGLALERCGQRQAAIKAYAKAYKHNPSLADPAINPLVLDSQLQSQARLLHYQREVTSKTLSVKPLNPQAVQQMTLVKPRPNSPPKSPQPIPPVTSPHQQSSSIPTDHPSRGKGQKGSPQPLIEGNQQPLGSLPAVSHPLGVKR